VLLAVLLFAGFAALGTWQLQRRTWKLDLIARVQARAHARAVAAPGPQEWARVTAAHDEYRRVRVIGTFLRDAETRVQANTVLGPGWWMLTPLQTSDHAVVLINRGLVPLDQPGHAHRDPGPPPGEVSVTGLLRVTEPGGALLHRNDSLANRWYSRDVQAIAAARGLTHVAPYFIDADDSSSPPDAVGEGGPIGGLTVLAFPNNHLAYALTWYALAGMVAAAAIRTVGLGRRGPT
jgi:surfeit locus 1 family protein